MTVTVRRVVTGHDEQGRAKVLSDGLAPRRVALRPGCDSALVWTSSQFPASNAGDADASLVDIGTSLSGGTVFRVIDYAPGVVARRHRTHSLDYAVVLSGEIVMELEAGEQILLRAGDVLVQRGTVHNWINRGSELCRIAFVLVGARAVVTAHEILPEVG